METLVALLLTTLLLGATVPLLGRWRGASERLNRAVEAMETERVVRDLLGLAAVSGGIPPLGPLSPPAPAPGTNELRVRNLVGTAVACGGGTWWYRGVRLPDPVRDSVAWADEWGRNGVGGLADVGPGTCAAPPGAPAGVPGRGLRLSVEGEGLVDGRVTQPAGYAAPATPVLVRIFESGRYRITDALRYGRTGSSVQPLTEATLDPDSSRLGRSGRGVELQLRNRAGHTRRRSWPVEDPG